MRESGILMPVSSLPGPYGIGCFGKEAFKFVDFLAQAGQKIWQILPLSPTGYGDSPYQSCSAFAGNPYFIDLDALKEEGLLTAAQLKAEKWGTDPKEVDYGTLYVSRFKVLRTAYAAWRKQCAGLHGCSYYFPDDYYAFTLANEEWLDDYALYMALKVANGMKNWVEWDKLYRLRDKKALAAFAAENEEEIGFWKFVQYKFAAQWQAVKAYANEKGISVIGDAPIFVSYDSADVWAHQKLFRLDSKGFPTCVTGVPPDYFSETGQLWGNPHYAWREHEKTGFAWWLSRIQKNLQDVDILRIDHFRGFSACWEVAFGAEDARGGKWASAPGEAFFTLLKEKLGSPLPLIAEDLGIITDEVAALRDFAGLPGMRILQFAFGQEKNNPYLPHCYDKNTVVYTGTHDNDTTNGWYQTATEQEKDHYRRYLNVDGSNAAWDFIRLALSSPADTAILPLQDVLSLGTEHRMNIPGTPRGNWGFTFSFDWWQEGFSEGLRYLSALFGRNEQAEKAAEETDEFLR